MGKGNWFSSVKKALSPESKEKKDQRSSKSKKKWFGKQKYPASTSAASEAVPVQPLSPPIPPPEEVRLTNPENEQHNRSYSVAVATTSAVEAEVSAPPAAVGVVQRSRITQFAGKSKEEIAAIRIQTAFRGYMSRRSLRALRGLVRLKSLMEGSAVKRQATNTLRCMQTLARVQSQIRYRRMRMSEENQALQRQLLQKHTLELEKLRIGDGWDDSIQSKEQVEAGLLNKHEAATRRERALAYAFSHQQNRKNSSKSINPMFVDPANPTWGWSWLERWMAARPWESRSTMEKDLNDTSSIRSSSQNLAGGEISKAYARFQLNPDKKSSSPNQKPARPTKSRSPSTPSKPPSPRVARKSKPASPMGSSWGPDDDSKSTMSVQSDRFRRHSIAGSSVRDDESMASSPAVPSYMTPTESARAKSRLHSPGEVENNGTPENGPTGVVKKRLSFPQTPARRHSDPPKVEGVGIGVSTGGSG